MSEQSVLQDLVAHRVASRIVARDVTVIAPAGPNEAHASIRNRLGWIDVQSKMAGELHAVRSLAVAGRAEGLTDVYLLGMGGSSLCAEVLRDVASPRDAAIRLTVLDTTDERAIRTVTDALIPEQSLFIVASKSGSTIEVTSLEQHFWSVMAAARPDDPGRHFIAIADPGTPLVSHAETRRYRRTFLNPPDIGGRYSALSLFGLVPAALLGLDVGGLVESGGRMAGRCAIDDASNPGLALGAFMGHHANGGRDKLTLLVAPSLAPIGVWIEQLVAESTGKLARGILPIVDEPVGSPSEYGPDRAFVAIVAQDGDAQRQLADDLAAAGHPVFVIESSAAELGGEFYRWQFATAVAGAILKVNPFDEPNVREAKQRTQQQLDARGKTGQFIIDPPLTAVRPHVARRTHRGEAPMSRQSYVAILDYLPGDAQRRDVVAQLRAAIRRRSGKATTYGVGPRYLHSTGQYHKGGPNSGSFVLLTAADESATPIPGTDFTFSVLKQAQALGDFEALRAAGRTVVHYHVDDPAADFSRTLEVIGFDLG